jgi:hypothetical protein
MKSLKHYDEYDILFWIIVFCSLVAGVTVGRVVAETLISTECGWGFYSGIVDDCKECPELRPFVRKALEDDKITTSEYADLIREQDRIEKEEDDKIRDQYKKELKNLLGV